MADFIPLTLDELPHLLSYIVDSSPRIEWTKVATVIQSEFGDSYPSEMSERYMCLFLK